MVSFSLFACLAQSQNASSAAKGLAPFGVIELEAAFELDGAGTNVDSIAFWEAPEPADTLLFVTAKGNDLLEVWRHPFAGNELPSVPFSGNVNGVAVDQEADRLYVSDRKVSVLSLPGMQIIGEFGEGAIGEGENNLAILKHESGATWVYVSEDHGIHLFNAENWDPLGFFEPPVSSIETVLADDFHQLILVPEEQGPLGDPGVYVYHLGGSPYLKNGTNRFGNQGEFDSDEEGMLLYSFPTDGTEDNGNGFYVVSDQRDDRTDFEIFDRRTWSHLGTLRITGVSNTDGIASTQLRMPGYPMGLFAAINDDSTTVGVGWKEILQAMGMTPYRLWTLDSGLTPGFNDGPLDDPDEDGRANLHEFAFDGDPLAGSRNVKQRVWIESENGKGRLNYTCAVREGAVFLGQNEISATTDGVHYAIAGSLNLMEFDLPIEERFPAIADELPALDSGWSYRTFQVVRLLSNSEPAFIRLLVKLEN